MRTILLALALLLVSSCASDQVVWKWSSDRGRMCFFTCQKEGHQCGAHCRTMACSAECDQVVASCLNACPDLQATR